MGTFTLDRNDASLCARTDLQARRPIPIRHFPISPTCFYIRRYIPALDYLTVFPPTSILRRDAPFFLSYLLLHLVVLEFGYVAWLRNVVFARHRQ
jgi:hypothetical protein